MKCSLAWFTCTILRKLLIVSCLCSTTLWAAFPADAQEIDLRHPEPLSPYIFGHNLEHTRAAVNGGLSAQMLQNRKFAGKPSRNQGLALGWFGIGRKVLYLTDETPSYTRHIGIPDMYRGNELKVQAIQNLEEGQEAGMGQYGLFVAAGQSYELRTVTRVSRPLTLTVDITDRFGKKVYASKKLNLAPSEDWVVSEFTLTASDSDTDASIRYHFDRQAELVFGAVSMLPEGHFHGMRTDVVEKLKAIGPRMLRWPGGNFAGEYRWKDGLLPVDQRAPLQAAMEIETQPFSWGYDFHEIGTDEFMALCREVGAQPMLTLNLAWSSPEESAQWVEYCNGSADTEYGRRRAENGHPEPYHVRFWSLGNEMGYGHMEGPQGSSAYAELAQRHVDAMLAVSPELELCSSGPYPNDDWARHSAARMAEKVHYTSVHHYANPAGGRHFVTPEETETTYRDIVASLDGNIHQARRMRESLDATGKKLHMSFDEWNQWYAWNRPSCVAEGIYSARVLHFYLNESNALDMPLACYFQPVGEGAILITPQGSRLTANGQVFALLKAHQDGMRCPVSGNGDYSTAATLRDGVLTVSWVNDSYDTDRTFTLPVRGEVLEASLLCSDDVRPHSYFEEKELPVSRQRKAVSATLPPHSVALIRIRLKK